MLRGIVISCLTEEKMMMPLNPPGGTRRSLLLIHADEAVQANRLAALGSHYGHSTRILDRHGLFTDEAADGLLISCRSVTADLQLALQHHGALARVLFCSRLSAAEQERLLAQGVWLVPHRCGEQERIESWLALARRLQMLLGEGARREQQLTRKLEERRLVEQVKGLLMRNHNLDEESAYRLLRKTAMDQGKSLAVLSRQLLQVLAR